MNRLLEWWHARNPRERILLAVMAAAIAAFAIAYGVVLPLRDAREAARERHARALALYAEVESEARALAALRRGRPAPPRGAAYAGAIVDAAGAAGVAIARQDAGAEGRLVVGIDATSSAALLGWLDALRQRHGIVPESLRVEKSDGRLRAEVVFAGGAR